MPDPHRRRNHARRSSRPARLNRRLAAGLAGALAGLACVLAGCALMRPTPAPMPAIEYRLEADRRAPCLIVLLPGRASGPEEFESAGLIAEVRSAGVAADLVAVDAHLGYYARQSVLVRLRQDVVAPARAAGCREVWLVGISMGGLGALLYAREHPDEVSGVLVLAPFLGAPAVTDEIERAGGLEAWRLPPELEPDDYQRPLWDWLRGYAGATSLRTAAGPAGRPPLYLGFGIEDKFARPNELLAAVLPDERVIRVAGGHRWEPWRAAFRRFLATAPLPRQAD